MSRIRNASNRKGGLQLGDVEQCALRSGNVHSADCYSADGWRAVLEPVISRYRGIVKRLYFRGDAQPLCPGADAEAGLVQVLDRGCRDALAHGLSEALKAAGASLADPGDGRACKPHPEEIGQQRGQTLLGQRLIVQR